MIPQKSKLDNRNVDAGSDKIRAVRSMNVQWLWIVARAAMFVLPTLNV